MIGMVRSVLTRDIWDIPAISCGGNEHAREWCPCVKLIRIISGMADIVKMDGAQLSEWWAANHYREAVALLWANNDKDMEHMKKLIEIGDYHVQNAVKTRLN
jgi:hypothetical protein